MQPKQNTNETIGNEAAALEALEIVITGDELPNYRKTITDVYKILNFVDDCEIGDEKKERIITHLETFRDLFDKMEEYHLYIEDVKLAS